MIEDFKAKIDREQIYKPTIENRSKHMKTNEKGGKMTEFATERDLKITGTFFQHNYIHKITCISPAGKKTDISFISRKKTKK